MSRETSNGALWVLLGLAALAAGATAFKGRGGRALRERAEGPLPFRADAVVSISCASGYGVDDDALEYNWAPGKRLPTQEELKEIATDTFKSRAYRYLEISPEECDVTVDDIEIVPGWAAVPTPRGKPLVYLT